MDAATAYLLGNRLDAHLPDPLYTQSILSGQGGDDARPEPTMSFDRLEIRLDPGTSRGVRPGDGQDRRLIVHLCYVKSRRCMKTIGSVGKACHFDFNGMASCKLRVDCETEGRKRRVRMIARRIQFRKQ
jgi:hypothetical protein